MNIMRNKKNTTKGFVNTFTKSEKEKFEKKLMAYHL